MFLIGDWACCLNPRELAVLRATAGYMTLTGEPYVPVDVWLSFCSSFGLDSQAMRVAFLSIYVLEIAAIVVDPELPPIVVVQPRDFTLWETWEAYFLTSASLCLDGCQQSKLPWQD